MTDCNEYNKAWKLQPFQKNNYFYGKLMSVSDFETEQEYMDAKRRLLSRLIFGNGIVCGLKEVVVKIDDGKVQLFFKDGGAALDRCGNEIIVPPGTTKDVYANEAADENLLDKDGAGTYPYVYLEYHECETEPVPAMSEISDCSSVCCKNRINESFNVIASKFDPSSRSPSAPPPDTLECPDYSQRFQEDCTDKFKQVMEEIREKAGHKSCAEPCEYVKTGAFIGKFSSESNGSALTFSTHHAAEYDSYVFTNPFLAELFACHMADDNPHKTLQGLKVDGNGQTVTVDNKDGYITIDKKNAITLKADPAGDGKEPKITIGENHSGEKGNPHETTHLQLKEVKGVYPENGKVPEEDRQDKHINTKTAAKWDSAVYSINKLNPDPDGNFEIEAGDNIDITPGANRIKISATGLYEVLETGLLEPKKTWTHDHNFGRYPVVDVYEKVFKPGSKKIFTFFLETEAEEMAKQMNIPMEELLKEENSLSLVRKRDDAIPVADYKSKFNAFFDKLTNDVKLKERGFEFYATEKVLRKNLVYGIAEKNVYFVFQADYDGRKILGADSSPDVEITINEKSVEVTNRNKRNESYFLKVILSA